MNLSIPAIRREDDNLLTGAGQFTDDIRADNCSYGYVVRSPYPHAEITRIDDKMARTVAGVRLVLIGPQLKKLGIGHLPCASDLSNRDGSDYFKPPRPILADRRVRYVGEPIAFIVADQLQAAVDAADLLEIEFAELESTCSTEIALGNTVEIWKEAPQNVCYDWQSNDPTALKNATSAATNTVEIEVRHPRMAVTPIEPRSAIASYDAATEQYYLEVQTQGVHVIQRVMAENILHIRREQLRVVTRNVGGSFGMKIFPYHEYALALIATKMLNQPVRWTATRAESFISDAQGRARVDRARLSLDEHGRFLAFEIDAISDLGAYLSHVGPSIGSVYAYTVIGHTYRIPHVHLRTRGVFTNATPTDAYRGAGKPETICTLEQLIDKAAFDLGIDRIQLRRINLVQPNELPYAMANGHTIDSGDFEALLDRAMEISDWNGFANRQRQARNQGLTRGIGLGMYMHSTSGSTAETCKVKINSEGTIEVLTGTQASGQGHLTSLTTIVAQALGIDANDVTVIQGDTDALETGGGTGGSSMLAVAGTTAQRAARKMLNQASALAAEMLEVAAVDFVYENGTFQLPGTDLSISLKQIGQRMSELPQGQQGCVGVAEFEGIKTTHPCGAYVAEIECDPETGVIRIIQLTGVDDVGRIINPAIVEGQLHGSWAQAVGTSLMEAVRFDERNNGQVLSGSLMDYQLPRALDLPFFKLDKLTTLCKTNAIGTKGAGEVANLGAPGAIQNAISDLLSQESFRVLTEPATPHTVWNILNSKKR